MKTRLLLLLTFLSAANLFATLPATSIAPSFYAGLWKQDVSSSTAYVESVKQTLTSGAWQQLDGRFWNGFRLLFEFQENGQAAVLCQQPGEWPAYQRYQWVVSIDQQQTILTLTSTNGQQLQYLLITTAKGMDLAPINDNRSKIETNFIPALSETAMTQLRRHFIGSWENNLLEGDSHMVHCEFRADGSYSRTVSGERGQEKVQEYGRWSVSKDGSVLLLISQNSNQIECIKIKLIQSDEMVLQETYVKVGAHQQPVPKNLYYSKL